MFNINLVISAILSLILFLKISISLYPNFSQSNSNCNNLESFLATPSCKAPLIITLTEVEGLRGFNSTQKNLIYVNWNEFIQTSNTEELEEKILKNKGFGLTSARKLSKLIFRE